MSKKLTVLVIEAMNKPYVKEIDAGLKSLQKEVSGRIQAVYPWAEPCAIVGDDEAKLTGKELNRALRSKDGNVYDVVAGTFLIVGLEDCSFASLSEEQIRLFSERFSIPEQFLSVNGKLFVVPVVTDRGEK
ncbi:MAG: DUF3846 domain-containing protein [Oscillospiraceae bacterium]|nr:DUF3846 domain-containing protein [Oscillospiraceae bacterium]